MNDVAISQGSNVGLSVEIYMNLKDNNQCK